MAYTTPKTWTAGEVVTAALMNEQIRDNESAIVTAHPLVVPSARVYNNAAQNINHNTWTTVAFNAERWDTDTIHDNSTNNSRLTCTTAGIYVINVNIVWSDADTDGARGIKILLNGATELARDQRPGLNGGYASLTTVYSLAATDYVTVQVYQNSNSTIALLSGANYSPEFSITYIGKAS